MTNINTPIWHWYHNVSECYYHIQITVKYRKSLLNEQVQQVIQESLQGIKERYAIVETWGSAKRKFIYELEAKVLEVFFPYFTPKWGYVKKTSLILNSS